MTYDDVVNVDAIGLITARSGVQLGNTGSGVTISSPSTNNFALQTNAVDSRVIINQNGSVGIGTTIPLKNIQIPESQFTFGGRGALFNWDQHGTGNQSGLLHNAYYSTSNEFRKKDFNSWYRCRYIKNNQWGKSRLS